MNVDKGPNVAEHSPGEYASRHLKRRRTQIIVFAGIVALVSVRQVTEVGLRAVLIALAGCTLFFTMFTLLMHFRAARDTNDECTALLPVWAAARGGAQIDSRSTEGQLPGTLRFLPGRIEWIPTKGSHRMGATPVRWNVHVPSQVDVLGAGRLSSQVLLAVYDRSGTTEACAWARATDARMRRLLALAVPESAQKK